MLAATLILALSPPRATSQTDYTTHSHPNPPLPAGGPGGARLATARRGEQVPLQDGQVARRVDARLRAVDARHVRPLRLSNLVVTVLGRSCPQPCLKTAVTPARLKTTRVRMPRGYRCAETPPQTVSDDEDPVVFPFYSYAVQSWISSWVNKLPVAVKPPVKKELKEKAEELFAKYMDTVRHRTLRCRPSPSPSTLPQPLPSPSSLLPSPVFSPRRFHPLEPAHDRVPPSPNSMRAGCARSCRRASRRSRCRRDSSWRPRCPRRTLARPRPTARPPSTRGAACTPTARRAARCRRTGRRCRFRRGCAQRPACDFMAVGQPRTTSMVHHMGRQASAPAAPPCWRDPVRITARTGIAQNR